MIIYLFDFKSNKMTELKIFSNIEIINIKGSSSVIVKDDGSISGVSGCNITQNGKTLTIAENENSCSFNGNSMNIMSNNSCMNIGSNNSCINVGSNSIIMHNNSVITNNFNSSGTMIINGIKIDTSRLKDIEVEDKKEDEKNYRLDSTCQIKSINVKGSGSLKFIHPSFTGDDINISVSGSGDVRLPNKSFVNININLIGSGDVKGDKTKTEHIIIKVKGSGDVKGFYVENSGSVKLLGSGDVKICAKNKNSIYKHKMGSGDIKISSY